MYTVPEVARKKSHVVNWAVTRVLVPRDFYGCSPLYNRVGSVWVSSRSSELPCKRRQCVCVCVGGVVVGTNGVRRAASRASSWRRLWALCSTVLASFFASPQSAKPLRSCPSAKDSKRTPPNSLAIERLPEEPWVLRPAGVPPGLNAFEDVGVEWARHVCVVCGGRRKMSRPVPFAHIKLSTFAREG